MSTDPYECLGINTECASVYAMTPMEYGERVQDALRHLIEERLDDRSSPVRSRAELSRALGHGEARQYVASRFKPDPKSGKVRDFTVPDLMAFASALGLQGVALLETAREIVDQESGGSITVLVPRQPSPAPQKRAARKKPGKPKMGDE